MDTQRNKLNIYLFSGLTLSAVTAALYILCFFASFDRAVGYFDASPLTAVLHALLALTILWVASLLLLLPRGGLDIGVPTPRRGSTVLAYLLTAAFVISVYLHIKSAEPTLLSLVIALLGGVSAAYAGCTAIFNGTGSGSRSLLGYGVIAWCFLSIVEAYFNKYVTMNSPVKLLLMFSMVFMMLFQLHETGATVGRWRPRIYAVFGLLNVLLSASFSLSYFACDLFEVYSIPEFLPTALVSLVYAAYTVSRLLDMSAARPDDVRPPSVEPTEAAAPESTDSEPRQ